MLFTVKELYLRFVGVSLMVLYENIEDRMAIEGYFIMSINEFIESNF